MPPNLVTGLLTSQIVSHTIFIIQYLHGETSFYFIKMFPTFTKIHVDETPLQQTTVKILKIRTLKTSALNHHKI